MTEPIRECMDGPNSPIRERGYTLAQLQAKYNELLFAVERKFPGESRHDTALRYIREAEHQDGEPAQCAGS